MEFGLGFLVLREGTVAFFLGRSRDPHQILKHKNESEELARMTMETRASTALCAVRPLIYPSPRHLKYPLSRLRCTRHLKGPLARNMKGFLLTLALVVVCAKGRLAANSSANGRRLIPLYVPVKKVRILHRLRFYMRAVLCKTSH